jgi:hypothetical protein
VSELIVYDKAKYHYEGTFPSNLPRDQAFVHIGMFLGWLCDEGLLSEQMHTDFAEEIRMFEQRKITGAQVLKLCGGTLASDMLNEAGNAFALEYFAHGRYLEDYTDILAMNLPSLYHVMDTWANYDQLAYRLNQRYREWRG